MKALDIGYKVAKYACRTQGSTGTRTTPKRPLCLCKTGVFESLTKGEQKQPISNYLAFVADGLLICIIKK